MYITDNIIEANAIDQQIGYIEYNNVLKSQHVFMSNLYEEWSDDSIIGQTDESTYIFVQITIRSRFRFI